MGFLSVIRRSLPDRRFAQQICREGALRDKMPIREIARRTGLSRNTIKKYLRDGIEQARQQGDSHAAAEMSEFLTTLGELGEL